LKVVSYNILNGGGRRLREIAGVIRSQRPDVVALQEATSRRKAGRLARELDMELVFGEANGKFHVAWLCRMPVRRGENHRVPGLAKTMLEIELAWDGQPLRMFTTHLAGGAEAIHPSREMPIILERLQRLGGEPHLLAGDLNSLHPGDGVGPLPPGLEPMGDAIDDDPRLAIRDILAAGYTDCFRALHPESPGYTYPAERPWLRLDYIFASPALAERLDASGIVDDSDARRASDHLPIWASFQ
jgi:endonuclease/exonuclease/phosphatase family metal-dependent hydrolase